MTGKRPVNLGNTNEVLRRFDSQARWFAAGLVSLASIAALAVAVSERSDNAVNHVTEEKFSGDEGLLNSNPSALSDVRTVNKESASSEMSSGQTISTHRTDTVIFPGQNSSPQTESPVPSQTPVSVLNPETYQPEMQADSGPMSPVQPKDTARAIRLSVRNLRHRQHGRLRLDVKARLIALWHESLARNQATRGPTTFWSSRKGKSQKLVTLVNAKRTSRSISGGGLDGANQTSYGGSFRRRRVSKRCHPMSPGIPRSNSRVRRISERAKAISPGRPSSDPINT